jgi:hypothetical protein
MVTLTTVRASKLASWSFCVALVFAAGLTLLVVGCKSKLHLHGGQVHGFVVAEFANVAGAPAQQIALPEVSVYLKNTLNGKHTAKVKTDALGQFATNNEKPGTYQVCAEATGFVAACDPSVIAIVDGTVVLNHNVVLAPDGAFVQGRILLKDGSPCYQDNQHFGTYVTTKVSLHDASGKQLNQPRLVNNSGYYVLPQVPGPGNYQIQADCDGFKGSESLTLAGLQLSGGSPVNVGLANSGPRITSVTATLNGTMVTQAAPGSTLTVLVRAYDPDGDSLHYKWGDGTSSFPTQDSSTIQWTLPATPSANLLWVQVTDGKGGYARDYIYIPSGTWQPIFGGLVVDRTTGRPVGGALVTINGARVVSAANGTFQYSGRKDDFTPASIRIEKAVRYVVNVRKSGYALLSRVVYSRTPQMKLILDRAARTTCNPASPCAASEQGELIATHVQFAANSIVDANGNPATAPVNVDVHGYDVTLPDPIPGDYSALDKNGKNVTMMTYGAINVDLTDASGNSYNLAPGKTAQISIPVNAAFLGGGTPPATLPLWSYNEQSGLWQEEVTATYDPLTRAYVGNVPHFSSWNADATFTGSACTFVSISSVAGPEVPFQLQAVQTSTNNVRHPDFTADSTDVPNFTFYFMIPNTTVQITVHPITPPDAVLNTITINSGAAIDPSLPLTGGIPPDPSTQCHGFDVATSQPPVITGIVPGCTYSLTGSPPAPTSTCNTSFQTYLSVPGATPTATESQNYIDTVDPTSVRRTLGSWKKTNGLGQGAGGANSSGEIEAIYFNNGDLQLGRDMHCLQTGSNLACYVTNYPALQGPSQPAIVAAEFGSTHQIPTAAADGFVGSGSLATVAMEYNHAGGSTAVSFYAYDNVGNLFLNPALDTQGKKFLPQNCMACHGGSYDATAHNADNSSFIAFDVYSFLYDSASSGLYGTTPVGGIPAYGSVKSNQEEAFRQLNQLVLGTNPNSIDPNQPIINLINGWYTSTTPPCNVNTANCPVIDSWAPTGWSGESALYQTIPRVYCRTCHSSQGSASSGYPDWTSYSATTADGFDNPTSIEFVACPPSPNPLPLMPHAEVPYKRFWLSTNPSGSAYLAAAPPTGIGISSGCPRQ